MRSQRPATPKQSWRTPQSVCAPSHVIVSVACDLFAWYCASAPGNFITYVCVLILLKNRLSLSSFHAGFASSNNLFERVCARAAAVFTYTDRDAILYALSVGVSLDALDPADLKFTYELHPEGQTVLPTFAVLFGFGAMGSIMDVCI